MVQHLLPKKNCNKITPSDTQ